MIKIEKIRTYGWEPALRGMRNPKNSWSRSDTTYDVELLDDGGGHLYPAESAIIGPNDYKLAMTLANAGPEHGKFLRMIHCYVDITAPLYWWKEFDTYKVGTTANSCSTMHKIMEKRFERDQFSIEHLKNCDEHHWLVCMDNVISALNVAREKYLETKNTKYWWQVIQLLPSSYNQMRTVDMNYAVLRNIYHQRQFHKQDEWRETFCKEFIPQLPYSELITGEEK